VLAAVCCSLCRCCPRLPLPRAVMAAGERCEAYSYADASATKLSVYEKKGAFVPFLTKMMLTMQESQTSREAKLQAHLEAVEERRGLRNIFMMLPTKDAEGEGTRKVRQYDYRNTVQRDETRPRVGSMAHILKEYGA